MHDRYQQAFARFFKRRLHPPAMHGYGYASGLRNRIAVSFFCRCFLPRWSLLTLCLARQSVLRGNVFNYKRKRVTVPGRVSRLSMTMTATAITTNAHHLHISLPSRDCESATMYLSRSVTVILLGINVFCLYKAFTYGRRFAPGLEK